MFGFRAVGVAVVLMASVNAAPATGLSQLPGQAVASTCVSPVAASSVSSEHFVNALNGLGFRLYDSLAGNSDRNNVFLSPASVEVALSMALVGARGSTEAQMAQALGLGDEQPDGAAQEAKSLLFHLGSSDPKAQLVVANSMWARKGVGFQPQFVETMRREFGAKVSQLDFSTPSAPARINAWVKCATNGAIPNIVKTIPPQVVLYLINAITFHGWWTRPFNRDGTTTRPFISGSGAKLQVPMMDQTDLFPYYAGSDFQMVQLGYGSWRFSMTVLLPRKGVWLAAFRSRLTPANWEAWSSKLRDSGVEVALPRFQLSNDFRLNGALSRLGMGKVFSRAADFSALCVKRCRLTEVRHKTHLKVNEEGTTASAVTSVAAGDWYGIPQQAHVIVDHPFFVAITDRETGSILFFGGVNQV